MKKTSKHVCFKCGAETETAVNRTKPPTLRRFVCTSAACWRAWYALADAK